jgi:hypothetical protein
MFILYLSGLSLSLFEKRTVPGSDGKSITIIVQRAPYVPEYALLTKPNLPDGSNPEVYPGRDFKLSQYQDLEAYIKSLKEGGILEALGLTTALEEVKTGNWSIRHYNLCGQDAAGEAVGVEDMMQAYVAFARVDEKVLINNSTAWTWQIRDLYRELGWEADQIGRFASTEHTTWLHWKEDDRLAYPTFSNVEETLGQGYVITPLVGIDSGTGVLSADPDAATGHFVNILETMTTRDGTQVVRVYNSAFHREEIYAWDQFDAIWERAGGNSGGQAVIARPLTSQP